MKRLASSPSGPLCHRHLLLLGAVAASAAEASNEGAALAAGLGWLLLGSVVLLGIVASIVAAFAPSFGYRRQLLALMLLVAAAIGAFGWLVRYQPLDFAFAFLAVACVVALLHACIYHALRLLVQMWRRRIRPAADRSSPV